MIVEWFELSDGTKPVRDYLDGLDAKLRAKTLRSMLLLEEFGHALGAPETRHLEDGIFELRSSVGGNAGRVLFFFFVGNRAVLTHGFVKKSQKTPHREIERAKRYRAMYLCRTNEEGTP